MRKDPSNPKYVKVEAPTLRVRIGPIIKEVIRIEVEGQTVDTGDSMEIMDLDKTLRDNNFQENTRGYGRQNSTGEYRDNRCNNYNRSRDRSREGTFSRNYGKNRDRSSSNSRSRSGSRASNNRDRIRCYSCREYDHFARNCPNFREERDLEQLQQMLNMEAKEQTHLLTKRQDSPIENYRTSPLNL